MASPHPGDSCASSPKDSAFGGFASALRGWLCGTIAGVVAAYISFISTIAYMKAVGDMSYQHDDVGFGLIGLVVCYGLLGIGVVLHLDK